MKLFWECNCVVSRKEISISLGFCIACHLMAFDSSSPSVGSIKGWGGGGTGAVSEQQGNRLSCKKKLSGNVNLRELELLCDGTEFCLDLCLFSPSLLFGKC